MMNNSLSQSDEQKVSVLSHNNHKRVCVCACEKEREARVCVCEFAGLLLPDV